MSTSPINEKIETGRVWADAELRNIAIERSVKINSIKWNESAENSVWIAEVDSAAGEHHTIALSYSSLAACVDSDTGRAAMNEKLRGLVGDLARIERRGYLR
jgi:hypothetical protein